MALAGTIYRLTVVGDHLGNQTQNAFWFTDKSSSLQDNVLESVTKLVNDWREWVMAAYALCLSSSWHARGVLGQVLNVDPKWMIEDSYETLSGGQDAESLPADCAGVVALDCALAGRSHRGRVYVPAIPKNATDGDYFTSGGLGQLRGFANELAGRFSLSGTSLDHVLIVYSRKLGDVRDEGPPVTITPTMAGVSYVQQTHARALICSMRRRRPDHGI